MTAQIRIYSHLFEMYPQMPKYAADPSQSHVIMTYDHIMLRFLGHYGCQPSHFVKSPLCPIILGDSHSYINLPTVSFCSSQSIIIAITKNKTNKIRLNHYETTLFGELQLQTNIEEWKFNQNVFQESEMQMNHTSDKLKNQQHNLVVKVLKAFVQINGIKQLDGMDVLVYKDFIEEEYLYSREAFIYGLYTAIHAVLLTKTTLQQKTLHKAYQKIADSALSHVLSLPQLLHSTYDKLAHISPSDNQKPEQISFPSEFSLIIANSMTPLPKKLTKGKRFNLRQCQIQIGIELIKEYLGIVKQVRSIKQLMETTECNIKEMFDTIDAALPPKGINAEKIQAILEKPLVQILKHIPYVNNVIDQNVQFHPYNRLRFFLEQQQLIQSLLDPACDRSFSQVLKQSSQKSSQLLQIASQQIDQIKHICRQFDASTKILGNGWGGCVFIMCKSADVQNLQKRLIDKFYLAEKNRILLGDDIDVYLKVVGKPQMGLCVLDPTNEIWYG